MCMKCAEVAQRFVDAFMDMTHLTVAVAVSHENDAHVQAIVNIVKAGALNTLEILNSGSSEPVVSVERHAMFEAALKDVYDKAHEMLHPPQAIEPEEDDASPPDISAFDDVINNLLN